MVSSCTKCIWNKSTKVNNQRNKFNTGRDFSFQAYKLFWIYFAPFLPNYPWDFVVGVTYHMHFITCLMLLPEQWSAMGSWLQLDEWTLDILRRPSVTNCTTPIYTNSWLTAFRNSMDAIMSATASPITGVSIVCSTVCSGEDQRKYQSSTSLAFVRGNHRWPVVPLTKGQ